MAERNNNFLKKLSLNNSTNQSFNFVFKSDRLNQNVQLAEKFKKINKKILKFQLEKKVAKEIEANKKVYKKKENTL